MITIRSNDTSLIQALIKANQQSMLDAVGSSAHKAKSANTTGDFANPIVTVLQVTQATATDVTTSVALVNNIKVVINDHFNDVPPHNTTTSSQVTTASATDLTSGVTLANALKTAINASFTSTSVHYTSDTTNTVTNANATDQTTLDTLLNEMKTKVNAHIKSAPGGWYMNPTAA